jgi:hypothetical protein
MEEALNNGGVPNFGGVQQKDSVRNFRQIKSIAIL